jgi:hypothetical protein
MKSHPKTHEADIMVGEGLHGLHPAHKVPAIEAVGKIVTMNSKHPRIENMEGGTNQNRGKTDPKDSKSGR